MKKWILLGVPAALLLLRFPVLAGFLLAVLVLTLGLAAFNTLCGALFGGPARACSQQLRERPLRCYLMGILALVAQVFAVLHCPPLAALFLLTNMAWLSFSVPALALLAGEGLGVQGRWAPAAGSLSMGLTLAFPPGWLLLSQLTLAALGSAVLPPAWPLMEVRQACWLLRCAGFGAPPTEVARLRKMGAAAWLDEQLRAPLGEVAPPFVTRLPPGQFGVALQLGGLIRWWMERLSLGGLREKMTLFWHGYFTSGIDPVFSAGLLFCQNQLLRENALGRFEELLLRVSQDPAMLVYLDGFRNRPEHPNENFAREVMELFTTGPGHYSEEDLRQAARAFTGWELAWLQGGQFRNNLAHHDASSKRFLNLRGQLDGEQILRRLARDPATAEHVCGRLWEFFCGQPAPVAEIQRLAGVFARHHGSMAVVLKALFLGEAFQDAAGQRQAIKGPMELCLEVNRILGCGYGMWEFKDLQSMGQLPFFPPSVAGWRQGDGWIDTSTLQARLHWISRKAARARPWAERGRELIAGCNPTQAAERLLIHSHQQDAGPALREAVAQNYRQPEVLQLVLASPEVQLK